MAKTPMTNGANPLDGCEVEQYVVLSTAHVTEEDVELATRLPRPSEGIAIAQEIPGGYGVRVKVNSDAYDNTLIQRTRDDLDEMGFSKAFCDLIENAIKSVYAGIIFDRDGEQYDHLPSFDW